MPLANITQLEPFNINSSATFSFANTSVTANVSAGNIKTNNLLYANGVAWTFGSTYSNTNVAAYLPTYTGNIAAGNLLTNNLLYANGTAWTFSNYSNTNVAAYLPTYTGNINANYHIGNGSTLTNLTGANVTGYVPLANAANTATSATTAGTVTTNAQPNITSVGTLTSLTSGLITATSGGIKVGNLQDPSGTNTIQLLNSNISVTGNIVAGAGGSGNVTANFFIGNGSQLTGLPASYSNTNVAAYLPTYSGNISASNLTVSTSANLGSVSNIIITGGTSGYVLTTDGAGVLSWAAQSGGGGGGTGVAVGSVQEFTANGTGNTYTLSTTPTNEDQLTVNIDGVLQLHSSYSVSGNVVTLSGTPVSGAKVEITNYNSGGAAGSNTQIQFNDSGNIAGSAALTFDKSSNTLNATNITSNGTPVATTGKAIAMSIVFGG